MAGRNWKSWKRQCATWKLWTGLFPGLVYGQAQNKPTDEELRSVDKGDLQRFLEMTTPNSFEDAGFSVQPGVTDQFYVRLEQLRERVNALV